MFDRYEVPWPLVKKILLSFVVAMVLMRLYSIAGTVALTVQNGEFTLPNLTKGKGSYRSILSSYPYAYGSILANIFLLGNLIPSNPHEIGERNNQFIKLCLLLGFGAYALWKFAGIIPPTDLGDGVGAVIFWGINYGVFAVTVLFSAITLVKDTAYVGLDSDTAVTCASTTTDHLRSLTSLLYVFAALLTQDGSQHHLRMDKGPDVVIWGLIDKTVRRFHTNVWVCTNEEMYVHRKISRFKNLAYACLCKTFFYKSQINLDKCTGRSALYPPHPHSAINSQCKAPHGY